jgi:hypothetical protein
VNSLLARDNSTGLQAPELLVSASVGENPVSLALKIFGAGVVYNCYLLFLQALLPVAFKL